MQTSKALRLVITLGVVLIHDGASADAVRSLVQPGFDIGPVPNASITDLKLSATSAGDFVTFRSQASNLVPDDTNRSFDAFLQNVSTGEITLVSKAPNGDQAPEVTSVSQPDSGGAFVAFAVLGAGFLDSSDDFNSLYVKDMTTGAVSSHAFSGTGERFSATVHMISTNGRFVYFSTATPLVPEHSSRTQLYRKDLDTGDFRLESVSADGTTSSNGLFLGVLDGYGNGRFILFQSRASNLTDPPLASTAAIHLYRRDTLLETTTLITRSFDGSIATEPTARIRSAQADFLGNVVFVTSRSDLVENDTNEARDAFYWDGSSIERVSLSNGQQINTGFTGEVAIGNFGKPILFTHTSPDIAAGDSGTGEDIFSYDRETQLTSHFPIAEAGQFLNGSISDLGLFFSTFSDTEHRFAFTTTASNIADITTAQLPYSQAYTHNTATDQTTSLDQVVFNPETLVGRVGSTHISDDLRWLAFSHNAANVAEGATPEANQFDTYMMDRSTNVLTRIAPDSFPLKLSPSGRYLLLSVGSLPPEFEIDLPAPTLYRYDRVEDRFFQIGQNFNQSDVNDAGLIVFSSSSAIANNDDNETFDVYLLDPDAGGPQLISQNSNNEVGDAFSLAPSISNEENSPLIVFLSAAANLTDATIPGFDIFYTRWPAVNLQSLSATLPELPNSSFSSARVTADGQSLAFESSATNLTDDDYSEADFSQLFRYSFPQNQTELISFEDNGNPLPDGSSLNAYSISGDGQIISYGLALAGSFSLDVRLVDTNTMNVKILNQGFFPRTRRDDFNSSSVVRDTSQTPPLISALFYGSDYLLEARNTPGISSEIYLHREGGSGETLTIEVNAQGSVLGPFGFSCQSNCQTVQAIGNMITFTAVPEAGESFIGWSGECNHSEPNCTIEVFEDNTLSAFFSGLQDPLFKDRFEP